MNSIVFNETGDFVLKAALNALNDDCMEEDIFDSVLNHNISSISVIELSRYKSLRELVNSLTRIKLASPAASVLLVRTENQMIPPLNHGAVNISASINTWKNVIKKLKHGCPNIDYIVNECLALINHQRLSPKQKRVIDCLGDGMNLDEISEHLFISVKTIYTYIARASAIYGFSTSKQFHRYILNETAANVCRSIQIIPHLPLSNYVSLL